MKGIKDFIARCRSYAITKRLVAAMKADEYGEVIEILDTYPQQIKWYFVDENGKTLMHLAAEMRLYSKAKDLTLFGKLIDLRIPVDWKDAAGKRPHEYARYAPNFFEAICGDKSLSAEEAYAKCRRNKANPVIKNIYANNNTHQFRGRIRTNDLTLYYNSTIIPDAWAALEERDQVTLTLHERLVLSHRYAVANSAYTHTNMVTANLGFMVSNDLHKSDQADELMFVTVPITDSDHLIYLSPGKQDHSEGHLFNFLNDEKNLFNLAKRLSNQYKLEARHKIYALVLDVHSTNEVCGYCEKEFYQMQDRNHPSSFIKKLETILEKQPFGFILPKEQQLFPELLTPQSRRLVVVTRVSFEKLYNREPVPTEGNTFYEYPEIGVEEGFGRSTEEPKFERDVAPLFVGERYGVDRFANSVMLSQQLDVKSIKPKLSKPPVFFPQSGFESDLNSKRDSKKRKLEEMTDETMIFELENRLQ